MNKFTLELGDLDVEPIQLDPTGAVTLEALNVYTPEVAASCFSEDWFLCSCCCC
ncbi:hypothetical protein [Rhizohabitans arisaemae]|uniref:hypothetical protein n=1 Tax=Rhizohabitans arisaemae TaxID=2720610 RepID=UPI0024B15E2A|nr:hypothetical protein [Rhizohabitans arisaemae]